MNLLLLDSLELSRVHSECFEDGATCWFETATRTVCGSKLGNERSRAVCRSSSLIPPCSAIFEPPVKITPVLTLRIMPGVRGSSPGPCSWNVPLVREGRTRKDFLDAKSLLAIRLTQKADNFGSEIRVRQPDQRPIVGNVECFRRSDERRRLAIADGVQFRVVNRVLAVFGADDDQGGIVLALTLQFRDDSSKDFVDEIELGGEPRCSLAKR